MNLTDIGTIKALLARHGFRFSKALGQNFLCDPHIPPAIAEGAGLNAGSRVLEVGPGIGTLTVELCRRAEKVVAVELDRRLPPLLGETLRGFDNFTLVEGDILKTDLPGLCRRHLGRESGLCAVANLPYYITTPALSALIDSGCFQSITVMVQREVAARICAAPGTADYGAFTVYINYHAEPRVVLEVPRTSFIPAPQVDSAVVRLDLRAAPPVAAPPRHLFAVVRAAFSQRRKTLANCLAAAFGDRLSKAEIAALLVDCGLSPNIRGETLSLADFSRIAEKLF